MPWDDGSWDDGVWDDGDTTTGLSSLKVELAFSQDPISTSSPTWYDVTSTVQSLTTNRGRDEQWGTHSPGQATITFLALNDNRLNVSGTLLPNTPVRISANDSAGVRQYLFAGFIQPGQVGYSYWNTVPTTTIQCHDALGVFANRQLPALGIVDVPGDLNQFFGYIPYSQRPTDVFGEGTRAGTLIAQLAIEYAPLFPGWQTPTLNNGHTILKGTQLGTDALSIFQQIAFSDGGAFYITREGNVQFDDRMSPFTDPRLATTQITFDDTTLTGQTYAIEFSAWKPPVYTRATVQMAGDDRTYEFENTTQSAVYGVLSYPAVTNFLGASSTEAQALAERLVQTSNVTQPCPKTIRLYPRRNDSALDACLQRELRDRCVFKSETALLSGGVNVHLERIQHQIDVSAQSWTCDLSFSSRDQLLWNFDVDDPGWLVLDDATKGLLDGTRGLAW